MTFFPQDPSNSRGVSQPNSPTWAAPPSPALDPFGSVSPSNPFANPAPAGSSPSGQPALDGPPTSIWVSLAALIGAAVVHLVSAIMLILWIYDLEDKATTAADGLLDDDPTGLSRGQVSGWAGDMADSVSLFLAGVFVLVAAIYILIAFLVKAGRNGARVTATVFACFSVFGLLAGPTGWLIVGLGVLGVVCMWLKPSNAYFQYRKMIRSVTP